MERRISNGHILEASLILILSLGIFILSSQVDLLERIHQFAMTHEQYELDEILPVALFLVLALAALLFRRIRELRKKNRELEKALAEINTLRGIIPICSSCKKIRSGEGYWKQVEVYIQEHSDVLFSHSLCPDCAGKLYGDLSNGEREV